MLAEMNRLDCQALQRLSAEMLDELKQNILPFWMNKTMDVEKGGYYGKISNDLMIEPNAPKGGILNSRILWTFSSAYRVFADKRYLEAAKRAYQFLCDYIWDKEYGGVYWMVDDSGAVIIDRKQAYNLAFAIYGLSEYYRVSGDEEALSMAKTVFYILERHYRDNVHGGYIEARSRDYSPIEDLRLSDKDKNEAKSMNTHLHILEAYTNLFRVWKSNDLRAALSKLLTVVLDFIVDADKHRFQLFFNEAWVSSADIVSYGHDIEGSWLLWESAEVLEDEALIQRTRSVSVKMAYEVLQHGVDKTYGGIYNEKEHGNLDTDKHWWPQAEAVVGFINAYQLTCDDEFLNAAMKTWDFIKDCLVDKVHGEWFWRCDHSGKPYMDEPKVEPWKCPYHNGRACMEIYERVLRSAV